MWYMSSMVCLFVLGAALSAPDRDHVAVQQSDQNDQIDQSGFEKRSPYYDFGLGKRAYSYVSEYKRLPVYNFGLGKRSLPYSFGLGKRSIDDLTAYGELTNEVDPGTLSQIFEQYDDLTNYETKRARPYSFGLGKRVTDEETPMPQEKRARMYNFGLGKRLPMYNFGLGKRTRSYNFGLGKRSLDDTQPEETENYLDV